jgi:glycosyltransferase involved in cell wall biosynthesis
MISVTILCKNNQSQIKDALAPLASFDEVLIFDTGSTDKTVDVAKTFSNVTIKSGTLDGFGTTHNLASSFAKNDWILSIDSDEVATKELVEEILKLDLDPQTVYLIPRHNLYRGKWIRWCGWHPDYQIKLYNKKITSFTDAKVHESVICKGMKKVKLKNPLLHFSYQSINDFLNKMQTYSSLFAEQNKGKKKSSPLIAIGHGFWTFVKSYLIKRGFMGGYEGFLISAYNGHTAFYKYLKLYEENKRSGIDKT